MSNRIPSALAWTGAGLTLLIAALVPFLLINTFSRAVAHAGLRVDENYTGGVVVRTIAHGNYKTLVYQPVHPHFFQRNQPFVQIAFEPISALPAEVQEKVDLDGDGQPDVLVRFLRPDTAQNAVQGNISALNSRYQSVENAHEKSFSKMILRIGNRIVLRVPMNP